MLNRWKLLYTVFSALDLGGIEVTKKVAMTGDTVDLACTVDNPTVNLTRSVAMTGDTDLAYSVDNPLLKSSQVGGHSGGHSKPGLHCQQSSYKSEAICKSNQVGGHDG